MQRPYYTDDRRARMSKRQLRRFSAAGRHSYPRDGGAGWGEAEAVDVTSPLPVMLTEEEGRRNSLLLLSSQLQSFIRASHPTSRKPADGGGLGEH